MTEVNEHRTACINALIRASITLLSRSENKFEDTMAAGVSLIADAAGIDRLVLFHNHERPDGLDMSQVYRWDRAQGGSTELVVSYADIPYAKLLLDWGTYLTNGNTINSPARLLPEVQSGVLRSLDVVSVAAIPIFISNVFWGFALFGDTHNDRRFDDDIIEMMRLSAFLFADAFIRIEMENEISGKDELTRVMFEMAPIGLTIFDENLRILDCNDFILNIYGVTKQYYLDHFVDFSPEYQPDGRKTIDKLTDVMWRTLNGEKMELEWMHNTLSGELIPCELILKRSNYGGKYLGVGYIHDLRNINKMQHNIKEMEKNIQLLEIKAEKIYYDELTGIYNRRYLDENLKRIMKSLSRSESTMSLLMIDIDFFKNYNDIYGHNEGDKCLKTIAHILAKTTTRVDDFVARYGGEEFVVVLPNTGRKGAVVIAERLLENVRNLKMPHEKSDIATYLTVSIGVTTGEVDHAHTAEDYIKCADEALYKSKHGGRDRYTFESLSVMSPDYYTG